MNKIIAKNVNEIADKFNNYMHTYKHYPFYGADYLYSVGEDIDNFSLIYEINWGDWKHDHLRFKELVYEFFMNSDIKIDMVITEENGSDAYSAEYKIRVNKF